MLIDPVGIFQTAIGVLDLSDMFFCLEAVLTKLKIVTVHEVSLFPSLSTEKRG